MIETVYWNDIGNTSAGNGKRVMEEMMEHVENRDESNCGYERMWYVLVQERKRVCAYDEPLT
jgi:hypothetical protein